MAVLKCKMCGGRLEVLDGATVCVCEYCGSQQTVPCVDDEKKVKLYERAVTLRLGCEFDRAYGVYESIVEDFPQEAEAYWGLLLCKYGIEYVDDPKTKKKIPTCHRSSFESIFDDPCFDMIMENADVVARGVYREEAKQIEEVRKGIIEKSSKEDPYDIFICYKETDDKGERTLDSVIAQDIYSALSKEGYRVFFARITLESKLGRDYEPIIFSALHSAKVMLAVGTSYNHYHAVWVKNEWSRYLKIIEAGENKTLIPCFKDIDAYDLPREFKHLQAQDMGKVGAIQDLLRGIGKIIKKKKEEPIKAAASSPSLSSFAAPLVARGMDFLKRSDFDKAADFFEKALDYDPSNESALLGKLLIAYKATSVEALINGTEFYNESDEYDTLLSFCSAELKEQLEKGMEKIPENICVQGTAYLEKRQFDNAKNCFDKVTRHFPTNEDAIIGKLLTECKARSLEELFIKEDFINSPIFNTLTAIWSDETKELFESSLLQKKESLKKEAEKAFETARYANSMVLYQRLVLLDGKNEEFLTKIFLSECKAKSIDEINEPFTNLDSYGALIKKCSPKTKEQLQVCDDNIKKRYLLTLESELKEKNFSSAIKTANTILSNWENEDQALMAMVFAQHNVSNFDELLQLEVSVKSSKLGSLAYQNGSDALRTRIDEFEKKLKFLKAKKDAQRKKKKRIALVTTSICLAVILISVLIWFLTLERIEGFEFESVDGGYAVVKYTGSGSEVVIPKTFRGKPVVTIKNSAFLSCKSLTSITIPDSVTNIGERAFTECTGLTNIDIPNSVTSIGYGAFMGCTNIKEAVIPTLAISFIPKNSLEKVEIIGGESIGDRAFYDCKGLTSVTIPNSVTSIGESAFEGCTGLTSITIPNSVTSIGESAFSGCTNLTSITIPNSVTSIGNWAFDDCDNLTIYCEAESKPSGWSTYWNDDNCPVVWGCENIVTFDGLVYQLKDGNAEIIRQPKGTKVTNIPESITFNGQAYNVTKISDSAFNGCTSLTSITIPNSVTSIGKYAFKGCTNLTSITIPSSVTSIDNNAFPGCTRIRKTIIPTLAISSIPKNSLEKVEIIGGESIGSYAFNHCTGLTSITIGNGVTSIGNYAFYGCTGLTSITIPNSVTNIGERAFGSCTGLTSITIPNSVTSVGERAFEGCTGLTSINIPNSVTSIGNSAFNGCAGLTSIDIPNGVTSIGFSVFENCTSLTSISIPDSVTSIGDWAFRGCTGLTSIIIPNSVTSIGSFAFYNCTGLTGINIPNSVTSIGDWAFKDCTSLTIYCEAESKPSGWNYYWNDDDCPVVWGHKN